MERLRLLAQVLTIHGGHDRRFGVTAVDHAHILDTGVPHVPLGVHVVLRVGVGCRITTARDHVVTVDHNRLRSHPRSTDAVLSVMVIVVVQIGIVDVVCRKREINILQALTKGEDHKPTHSRPITSSGLKRHHIIFKG